MGAYLSQPKTDKTSTDECSNYLSVGASSMQGWRNSQEDAHNSILNFDTNTAFFAVYDGHGGAEVSTYCADKFPQFLKSIEAYVDGNYEDALVDAFLGFDKTLLDPEVIEILKILAGEKNFVDGEDSDAMEDDDDEDLAELHEEGNLPLDKVMEKYKGHPSNPSLNKIKDSSSSKPQSPYLRGRRAAAVIADAANRAELDPDSKPEGSSTSKAALAALQDGASSSKSSSSLINKIETKEDATVSSSSSSASKPNNANNSSKSTDEAEAVASASTKGEALDNTLNGKTTDSTVPDSSVLKDIEQNGNVSSSEVRNPCFKVQISSLSKGDATVTGSSDTNKKENKQNGNVESSTKSAKKQEANSSAITSTSKDKKKDKINDEEDDAEFETNESNVRQALEYSSEDEEQLEDDDTTDEDADYDDDVEEDDEEGEDEEDEESYLANEQFCANMIEEPGKDSGCTAVVGLLHGRDLYVANAGDSRCVVCRNGKAIEMSLDHKPEDDEESARIIKAGGRVTLDGRVNGGLNLSRALGDHAYKMNHDLPAKEQMISALPDVKKLIISDDDEFMVLACDGIWNFMTSEEVVEFVRLRINDENKKMSEICEELFDACLAPNTLGDGTGCDNMTAVIVRFKPSILKLPTNINPDKTEDVLLALQEKESEQKAQKRAASPSLDDNNSNEADNNTKRLKTDNEENMASSSSSKMNSTSCSSMPIISTDAASTTSTNEESSSTTMETEVQKECGNMVASST